MKKLATLLLSAGILLAGCAIKVSNSFDKKTDFSQYKTFCWLQGCEFTFTGPLYLNDSLIVQYLQEGIRAEMENKGLQYDSDQPDLLLDFHVTVESRENQIYRFQEDDRYMKLDPISDTEVYYYLEGTIVIDMVEKESGRMVWRSQARRYLDVNPELSAENLRRGISIILRDFPPSADEAGKLGNQ